MRLPTINIYSTVGLAGRPGASYTIAALSK
jgi:hypothetical protein